MRKGRTAKPITVIVNLFLLLLVFGVIAFIFRFTNGFKGGFTTFYLESDGKQITNSVDGVSLPTNTENRFDVKYTFSAVDSELTGYTVKVVPNADFDFTVDGVYYSFGAETDLTSVFDIKTYNDYFTVYLSSDLTIQTVLDTVYSGQTVVIPNDLPKADYFSLMVTSYDGKSSVSVNFTLFLDIAEIILDKGEIVF